MSGGPVRDSLFYRDACREAFKKIETLEQAASIHEKADRIRQGPIFSIPTTIQNDTPIGSARFRQEVEADQREEAEYIRRRLRELYSTIGDIAARREIMGAWLELYELETNAARASLAEARHQLKTASALGDAWPFWAAVLGIVFVLSGHAMGQMPGALAGAVVAYFIGRWLEANARQRKATAMDTARLDIKAEEGLLNRRFEQPCPFNREEARTGELAALP